MAETTSVTVLARDAVEGTEPVEDGRALGRALASVIHGAKSITVDLDGLRLGTVCSAFINAALDELRAQRPSFDIRHGLSWQSKDEVLIDIAIYCVEHWLSD